MSGVRFVVHAPAVLTGDVTARQDPAVVVVHAPEVTVAQGALRPAVVVVHAPEVTTQPTFTRLDTAAVVVMHAPEVTNNARTVTHQMVAYAPSVTASQAARIVHYRSADPPPVVAHAPAVTTAYDQAPAADSAPVVMHAPAVTAAAAGAATVGVAVMVAYAPAVTVTGGDADEGGPMGGAPMGGDPMGG